MWTGQVIQPVLIDLMGVDVQRQWCQSALNLIKDNNEVKLY